MLKSMLSIAGALAFTTIAPLHAAESAAAAPAPFLRAFPGAAGEDGPVRHALRSALQRLLAFRNETPLSTEQRTQVRGILEKHRDEIRTQFTAARSARTAMHKAVLAGTDAQEEAARLGESARTRALLHAKLAREIRPVLTPEQRQRLDSTVEQFQAEMGQIANVR